MERHLKERMVGAVALVAIAVIFIPGIPGLIPGILSGPRTAPDSAQSRVGESISTTNAGESASKLKTYTIDLTQPGAAGSQTQTDSLSRDPVASAESIVATPAPPSEEVRAPADVEVKTQNSGTTHTVPSDTGRAPRPIPETAVVATGNSTKPVSSLPGTAQSNSAGSPSVASGWAVQVGSFGVRSTSERIAADLRKEGFTAFVVAFQAKNQTMYRVRVGPERDRAAAESLLRKLKLRHPNATLVPAA